MCKYDQTIFDDSPTPYFFVFVGVHMSIVENEM